MSSIIKGITDEQHVTKKEPEVHVPGYGTIPLDMLKRHVQSLSKDFDILIQQGAFLKAAYRSEQFYNALMALAKALPKPDKVDETHSTGTTVGSAGIGGGAGLGIDKSPIEKVIEKPLGEGQLPPKAGFNKKPHKVGPGTSKDDYEYKSYIPRDRKEKGEEWAIARDVRNVNSKVGKKKPKELDTGFYKNYLGNRPVREGEVVSMQARKTPLVIAGEPYDWDIYDLRTNKMVANILGGDRHDKPLYEIRINSNGMTPSTRMLPTYVLKTGPNNNPPYRAYELEAPSEVDKMEKGPGPGGTTKLKPDTMDVFSHMAKQTAKGRYYGYNTILVEEGLDQYEIIEKALGAKIMEIDDAMELGYTDWNEDDSSGYPIIYLGNKVNESLPTSPGGMGQSYRKFTPKVAGLDEEQAPMFTPEEKMVNANDPMSDGRRIYKAQPAGEQKLDEKCWDTHKQVGMKKKGGKMVPNCIPKESSIMKGLQTEAGSGVTRWSKENPPPPELLLNTLIQILMNPNNNRSPQDLISLWNEKYGLKHTLGGLRQYAQNDYKKAELSKALQKAVLAYESSKGK